MNRYPMCEDQPAQIDCRNTGCKWHVNAACTNISPAITLTDIQPGTIVMTARCWSFEPKIQDHATNQIKPGTDQPA